MVIATRLLWVNTTPYLIRAIDRRRSQVARRVGWRPRLIAAWSGLRGSVSLAAALALPHGFPERDLLIFLTLAVIFATLVGQGLTLPILIRRLGVEDDGAGEREEPGPRARPPQAAIEHLAGLGDEDWTRTTPSGRMIRFYDNRRRRLGQRARAATRTTATSTSARSPTSAWSARCSKPSAGAQVVELRNEGAISGRGACTPSSASSDLEDQRPAR